MGLVNILGSYVYQTSYDDLPEAIIDSAKDRILDLLGVAFLGYTRAFHQPILKVLQTFGTNSESTVIGEGVKLTCSSAALINSSMCADSSDGDRYSSSHPSAIVIPAALAVAEAQARTRAISGKDLILSVVLGYEMIIRIARAISPSARNRGFSVTPLVGPLATAAAAGKLMNLSEESMTNALSIASILGSGLMESYRASQRTFVQLQIARGCEAGVISALLGQAGLKGNDMILEKGLIPAVSDEYSIESIKKGLGQDYMLAHTYMKRHAGWAHCHPPVDAILSIVDEHNVDAGRIEQIRVKVGAATMEGQQEPNTIVGAKFNIPFLVSLALLYGDAAEGRFTDQNLSNQQIQKIMTKVKVEHAPELDNEFPAKRCAIVEVVTKDGETFRHRTDFAKGQPEFPLSKADIEYKFQSMASGAVSAETRRKIADFVNSLETKEQISDFFVLLKATG